MKAASVKHEPYSAQDQVNKRGKVGEPCVYASQCESLACEGDVNGCKTCQPELPAGADCVDRDQCPLNFACTEGKCTEDTLRAVTESPEGGPCDETHVCLDGFECTTGTCTAVPPAPRIFGVPCDAATPCSLAATCQAGVCVPSDGHGTYEAACGG